MHLFEHFQTFICLTCPWLHYCVNVSRDQQFQGGSLTYETELGARLTFNLKDVQDASELSVGDEVEFVILTLGGGQKTAVNIQKATDRPRPERLLSRIKSVTDDQCPRAMAIRQPKGPDGTKGFKCPRKEPTPARHNNPSSAPLMEKTAKEDLESSKGLDMAGGDVMVADQAVPKNEEGEVFEGGHQVVHRQEGSVMWSVRRPQGLWCFFNISESETLLNQSVCFQSFNRFKSHPFSAFWFLIIWARCKGPSRHIRNGRADDSSLWSHVLERWMGTRTSSLLNASILTAIDLY